MSFIAERFTPVEKGDPDCKHEWPKTGPDRLRCVNCPATRTSRGYTAHWDIEDPATGKRRQLSKAGFETKGAADKYLKRIDGKIVEGSYRPDQPLTVRQLMEQWLSSTSKTVRGSTLHNYRVAVNEIVNVLGAKQVAALVPGDVVQLVDMIDSRGVGVSGDYSKRKSQVVVAKFKQATKWALANGMLSRDPLAGVALPRVKRPSTASWSVADAQDFMTSVVGDQLEAAWALLITRGLRRGEVAGLRWDCVDFINATLTIKRTLIVVDGKAHESEPKTESSYDTVPLDALLVELLHQRGEAQRLDQDEAGSAWQGIGHVFTDKLGKPLHPEIFSIRFHVLAEEARLTKKIRLHDLRHTCASILFSQGVPVPVVARILRHASPATTMSTYAHMLPGADAEATAALSAALLGSRSPAVTD